MSLWMYSASVPDADSTSIAAVHSDTFVRINRQTDDNRRKLEGHLLEYIYLLISPKIRNLKTSTGSGVPDVHRP